METGKAPPLTQTPPPLTQTPPPLTQTPPPLPQTPPPPPPPNPNPAGLQIPNPNPPKKTPKKKMRHSSTFAGEKVDQCFCCSICGYKIPLYDMEEHYEACAASLH